MWLRCAGEAIAAYLALSKVCRGSTGHYPRVEIKLGVCGSGFRGSEDERIRKEGGGRRENQKQGPLPETHHSLHKLNEDLLALFHKGVLCENSACPPVPNHFIFHDFATQQSPWVKWNLLMGIIISACPPVSNNIFFLYVLTPRVRMKFLLTYLGCIFEHMASISIA